MLYSDLNRGAFGTRSMLKSKIHRATVTEANLDYDGSITIDNKLLEAADILPFEEVQVWNVTSGTRFATYTIPGEAQSGVICINGAAAHLAKEGDLVIIASFTQMEEMEARSYEPLIVLVDEKNQPRPSPLAAKLTS